MRGGASYVHVLVTELSAATDYKCGFMCGWSGCVSASDCSTAW